MIRILRLKRIFPLIFVLLVKHRISRSTKIFHPIDTQISILSADTMKSHEIRKFNCQERKKPSMGNELIEMNSVTEIPTLLNAFRTHLMFFTNV